MEDILEFGCQYQQVMDALPPKKEMLKMPRQYLANMIYTITQDQFSDWVDERVQARNAKVTQDKGLVIDLDPRVAQAFAKSTSVSRKLASNISLIVFVRNLNHF